VFSILVSPANIIHVLDLPKQQQTPCQFEDVFSALFTALPYEIRYQEGHSTRFAANSAEKMPERFGSGYMF
jgi:hypothetical protein